MKRNMPAKVLAVAVLLGALVAIETGRFEGAGATASTPENAIYDTMSAARAGNVGLYLSGYTGQMRVALQRSLEDSGGAAFARYLQASNAGVMGLAVSVESSGDRDVKARVEYVYQDRNDVQVLYLVKERGTWRIAKTDGDQPVKAAIPYGTPIATVR